MGLCTIAQVRAAGLGSPGWTDPPYTDALIQGLIDSASQLIEESTGNRFTPTTLDIWLEGNGQQMLRVKPVLSTLVGAVIMVGGTDYTTAQVQADIELVELEGKKCRQYLRLIDSTAAIPGVWPLPYCGGDPNIKFTGSFGWLDDSGSPTGQVPQPIEQLCIDLVADGLTKGYIGSSSDETSGVGALKRDEIDVWEQEYHQSANETIARAIGDDWAKMVWSAYTCPRPQMTVVPFGRG